MHILVAKVAQLVLNHPVSKRKLLLIQRKEEGQALVLLVLATLKVVIALLEELEGNA